MIGTPCYDGRLDVWYTNSLVNTVKLAKEKNIEIAKRKRTSIKVLLPGEEFLSFFCFL